MGEKKTQSKSTKDIILDVAFSFFSEPRYSDFSMSELASKVGVSKTAIYRHFENKEAVLQAMYENFMDEVSACMKDYSTSEPTPEKTITKLIEYFLKKPELINYYICCISSDENYQLKSYNSLVSRGCPLKGANDFKIDFSQIFTGLSILFFIKIREKTLSELPEENSRNFSESVFSKNIVNLIFKGLKGTVEKSSILYPQEITAERKAELKKLCKIDANFFPEENKIFEALAKVIIKYKLNGVTVERIAKELNMAKSSLYFYFENKNELIRSLIEKELSFLSTLVHENGSEAKNLSEYFYISLITELQFFYIRPSLIPICGWLLQTSVTNLYSEETEPISKWETMIPDILKEPDLGFPLKRKVLALWIGIIPISLIILSKQKNLSFESIYDGTEKIYNFIQNGIR